ncbi:MAG: cell division protein FtsH, partial [Methylococcaceae bacterium]|nr:cell division protein FtsH [Methylococcaceae bacterium]
GYMGPQSKPMSEQMAQVIDEEIRQVVDRNYLRAETILKEHIKILHNMAHALLDWETIDKFQIDELMQGRSIAPPEPETAESTNEQDHQVPDDNAAGQPHPDQGQLALS